MYMRVTSVTWSTLCRSHLPIHFHVLSLPVFLNHRQPKRDPREGGEGKAPKPTPKPATFPTAPHSRRPAGLPGPRRPTREKRVGGATGGSHRDEPCRGEHPKHPAPSRIHPTHKPAPDSRISIGCLPSLHPRTFPPENIRNIRNIHLLSVSRLPIREFRSKRVDDRSRFERPRDTKHQTKTSAVVLVRLRQLRTSQSTD